MALSAAKLDLDQEMANDISRFHNRPLDFVRYAFDWGQGDLAGCDGPDQWQVAHLTDMGEALERGEPLQLATASGHGVGKSATVAWIILWAMSTRPDLTGVVTANTAGQLKDKTWAELSRWHRRAINAHWFKWTATKFFQPRRPETWFVAATPWSKENTEAFAGLHAKDVLIIMDEASAIPDVVWETAAGAMTTSGAMMFCYGNPTRNTGRFRECFGRFRHRWITRQVDSREAKMVDQSMIAQWAEDYGEDSDFFRVRVRGVFPNVGDMQFISTAVAEEAAERAVEVGKDEPLVMGVDVARFGGDQSVIWFRQGRSARVFSPLKFRGLSTDQFADRIIEQVNYKRPAAVFIDGGGVGGPVVDMLNRRKVPGVIEINFGGKAERRLDHGGEYANKRAEMWDAMREWLKVGAIPNDRELIEGLTGLEYGYDKLDRLILERKEDMKKRGLASPDEADALALTFAKPVATAAMRTARPRYAEMD